MRYELKRPRTAFRGGRGGSPTDCNQRFSGASLFDCDVHSLGGYIAQRKRKSSLKL